MALWHDRRGRFSPLRAATLALLVAPFFALVWFTFSHQLGPRPRTEAIHEVGLWAIRFLMLSLFVTPMRRIARYAPLVDIRRMLGVGCFAYIALHLLALHRRSDVRSWQSGVRNRAPLLPHHRFRGLARTRHACCNLEQLHGSSPWGHTVAATAPAGVSHRGAGKHSLFHAVEARGLRTDRDGRDFHLADAVPPDALEIRPAVASSRYGSSRHPGSRSAPSSFLAKPSDSGSRSMRRSCAFWRWILISGPASGPAGMSGGLERS